MTVDERLALFLSHRPDTSRALFVAPSADVVGDVTLETDSSVWYQCVLRGDINSIVIGEGTNIQDGTVVHLADDAGVVVGSLCTVGHQATLHACTVGDECLIGMGATVLDYSIIGNRCLVGAGALVTKGTVVPDGSLVLGAPARVVRTLTVQEQAELSHWAAKYLHVARAHARLRQG